ncbi:hypothetical protein N9383_02145 [Granulosicoccus sp.]|nr:hypothetical protein [Granulosicoccus sp.]
MATQCFLLELLNMDYARYGNFRAGRLISWPIAAAEIHLLDIEGNLNGRDRRVLAQSGLWQRYEDAM